MRLRRAAALAAAVAVATVAGVAALDAAFPPDLGRVQDVSVLVTDRKGVPLRAFLNGEDRWRLPAAAGEVPPLYVELLLAYEDKRFREHWGVDPLAALRAAGQNLAAGRVVSGASTLTMQVARLLEPAPRGWATKLRQAVRALQLERRYGKDEILAMYLTLAPFGGNLEGVRAASMALFGKGPAELTPPEAALLVALPRLPTTLRPDRHPERARAARDAVLARAVAAGVLTPTQAAEAAAEPVPGERRPMPMAAFHLAGRLKTEASGRPVVRTTLDGGLQRAVEGLARDALADLDERAALAILVVEHGSRGVLAEVGAADPLDYRRTGPVDMVQARRSPGSALKPFVYALGFTDGLLQPESLVADVSTRFGDYAPRNFHRDFAGELTVREALQRSLNVPAVLVLDKVGPLRFVEAVRRTGVRLDLPSGVASPGLPIVLGGVGVSLWDMVTLYTGLAREGRVAPLRALADAVPGPVKEGVPLVTPEAARQTLRILEGAAPPDGIVQRTEVRARPALAVKTGTSYGFRDAWAFGVSARHVVGVWVGRPDGSPSPGHYGRNTAAPLLFRVFDLLPADPAAPLAAPSAGLEPGASAASGLRRVAAGAPVFAAPADRPHLVFPSDGMVVEALQADGSTSPLLLEASGGRRPLSWLVDGRRIAVSDIRRDTEWRPAGPGFTRITVVDADGRSDSATVEIR